LRTGIVGFTPGSTSDITGRLFAKGATPIIGQQIVVENKPGAAGSIAAQYVSRAAKDGYTLSELAVGTLVNEIISPNKSVVLTRDFVPVALLADGPFVLVVNPETNLHSVCRTHCSGKIKSRAGARWLDRRGGASRDPQTGVNNGD
jgi:tripartite-type tricarboxylate transporter receptor subunit TctC